MEPIMTRTAFPRLLAVTFIGLAGLLATPADNHALAARPGQSGSLALKPLSALEISDLSWMREEEKVARDVYLHLYGTWKTTVFSNIATSEQRHMDAIKARMVKYNVSDPALPTLGVFSNADLQALYDDLVARGDTSLEQALRVGALIEEVDILDLQAAIDHTTHADIKLVYQNLLEGSKNHLRAFVARLRALGVVYSPVELDAESYELIIGL
jgi:hypothetical protein